MAIWKGTMWFVQGKAGWSECVYLQAASARDAAMMFAPFVQARAGLLAQGVVPTRWHTSLLGVKGTLASSGVAVQVLPGPPNSVLQGLLLNVQGKGPGHDMNYSREYFLRGLPLTFIKAFGNPATFQSDPTYTRLQTFIRVLTNGDFLLQVAAKQNPWYPVQQLVTSFVPNNDQFGNPLPGGQSYLNMLLPDGAIIPDTDPVTGRHAKACLRNAKWSVPHPRNVNGVWPVAASFPGFVSLQVPSLQDGDYVSGGFVQLRQTLYVPIVTASPARLGNRKCGKPLYPSPVPVVDPEDVAVGNGPGGGEGPTKGVPQPPPNLGPWNPGGVRVTLASMQDTAAEVFAGYTPTASGLPGCIRISPIVNRPNTYFVALSGTDLEKGSATGILSDVLSFFSAPDAYLQSILQAIYTAVPVGSKLWLFGHSLGGMEAQNVSDYINTSHYTIERVVCMGTPMTNLTYPYKRRILFAAESDFVPLIGRVAFLLAFIGSPELTFIFDPPGVSVIDIFAIHNGYPTNPDFLNYGPDGERVTSNLIPTLELGPVQIFTAPASGPSQQLNPQQREILREWDILDQRLIE